MAWSGAVQRLTIQTIADESEPRVLDTLLGEAMGLARPTNIRTLIEGNRAELETFGQLHSVRAVVEREKRGAITATAFYLNEEQALLVVSLSHIDAGRKLRAELIWTKEGPAGAERMLAGRGLEIKAGPRH